MILVAVEISVDGCYILRSVDDNIDVCTHSACVYIIIYQNFESYMRKKKLFAGTFYI